jgi:hypothetical protein
MPNDLVVSAGTTTVLNDTPPPELADAFVRIPIRTLNDLAKAGIIASTDTIEKLLESAKRATVEAIARNASGPFVPIFGTSRPDLRRFGTFLREAGDTHPREAESFWRVARTIDPRKLSTVTTAIDLTTLTHGQFIPPSLQYFFTDVTVERDATLVVGREIHAMNCLNLVIRRTGRIVAQGGGLAINAFSIFGEQ